MGIIAISGIILLIILQYRKVLRKHKHDNLVMETITKLRPVPQHFKTILQKYFPYYQQLSDSNKTKFSQKVTNFIYSKRFIPRNVNEVTIEAKVLIAASAVQLTFGLPDVNLRHFNKILVYPDNYYSSITKRYHKGEVNPRFGMIVLSWQAFVDGYIYPTDSINLGLHEMAHALRLENLIRHKEYRFFDETCLKQLDAWAHTICNLETHTDDSFFRPYACVNTHEFFSVAVENFFERSRQFKNEFPELYAILVRLLGQDPLVLTHQIITP
jgi:Mlc titration factor MtfA (ptsG expression regulator)